MFLLSRLHVLKKLSVFCRRLSAAASFQYSDLTVSKTNCPQIKPDNDNLVFGKHFSDHMLSVKWTAADGWRSPHIHPVEDLNLHPAAKVLHYAPELFEGLKAYWGVDQQIRMFRPMENMKRMNRSAERSSLPMFDGDQLLKCIKALIRVDESWVPRSQKCSLYIRPTMIGTEASLGVAPPDEALLFVLTGPVGPYYPTGLKPVSLLADPQFVRAWKGGSGDTKMGSNYAPTVFIAKKAAEKGCQQVLWLYDHDHKLTEVGTMNVFIFWTNEQGERELLTPPLNGTILPGVTRMSLLDLARQWGEFSVREAEISMPQVLSALRDGRLLEMFGAGTACVVSPIHQIMYQDQQLSIPTMSQGAPITMRFLKHLTDIQYGRVAAPTWTEIITEGEPASRQDAV